MIIERPLYLNKILPFVETNLIKTLVGQRRVGKSYILKSIAQTIIARNPGANIININLEDFAFAHVKDASTLYSEITKRIAEGKKNYIFIDEIQEVEEFEKALRSLILDERNDVYITGSNSKMLSSEISSVLSGRNIEFRIHPLSYSEFLIFHKKEDSVHTLNNYIRYGGMPFLKNLPQETTWEEYLSGITDAIVFRDIIKRHSIRNSDFLQRLLSFIADNIGKIFSAKRIADYLKSQNLNTSVSAIQNYTSYIEEACVANRVRRWNIEGKKFFEIGEKIFYEDLGIRNSIVGLKPGDIGGIMENLVYNHLTSFGYKVTIGSLPKGKEIDFIAEKNGEIKYFQVATSILEEKTIEREYGNLLGIHDNYEKTVITFQAPPAFSYKGIRTIALNEFLLSDI